MNEDLRDRVVALETELDESRAEVRRLRGLLGLDERDSESHRAAPSPMLFEEREPSAPRVTAESPNRDKLRLFRELFGARTEVYATRWENTSKGTSGWSPSVRGGWSKKRPTKDDLLPLTDEVFAHHLRGEATHGIYPLLSDDTCALLVCDFDGGTWALDALAYLDACQNVGMPAVLERSRSGDGAHVWVFFAEPVAAASARSLGASLLRVAMTSRAELDLSSYDRFFPSQDFMPKAGFGNLIALPLHGERLRQGNTAFLDPTTMQPWPDQWAFLDSIRRLPATDVLALAKQLRPVEAGPALCIADLIRADGPAPPEIIHAQLNAMLSIERAGLPPALLAALKHLASLHNPDYYEKQRMRFSTWDTPQFIRCYEEDLQWLHLPRGLAERASALVEQAGSRLSIEDRRLDHPSLNLSFDGTLRPAQSDALAAVEDHDYAVLVAPPGAGKTVMACAAIAHHDVATLVLVDRKPLIDQWRARLCDHLGLEPGQIGQIGGGQSKPTGIVDVAMLQSVTRRDDSRELFSTYGLVVVDECHHLPAVSFDSCVRHAPVKKWLGLTATPYRRDGLEGILFFQCGPTRHEIPMRGGDENQLLRLDLVVHETTTDVAAHDEGIQAVFRTIVEDDNRTHLIAEDIHHALEADRTCLVLTQRTDHIERIVADLIARGHAPLVLQGGLGKQARQAVMDALSQPRDGSGLVLVATGSYLGEGFDWPACDTLFLAFPIAFKGRVVQYVGRLLRADIGKDRVELHDYVDTRIPVLERMHRKRLPVYATLGFDVPKQRRLQPTRTEDQDDQIDPF